MKTFIKMFLCLVIVFTSFASNKGQTSSAEFRSVAGRFGIQLPQQYTDYKPLASLKVGEQKIDLSIYKWQTRTGQFAVGYGYGYVDFEAQANSFLSDFRKMYLGRLGANALVKESARSIDNHPGLELITEAQDIRTIIRVFFIKNRLYLLTLSLDGEQRKSEETSEKIFSTFRLLSSAELSAERDRIAQSFEPEALPQEPIVSKAKSDAEDRGLKGKVKQILTEDDFYYNENLFGNLELVSLEEFNERGNIVKRIKYYSNLPEIITVFGYVNGERAARQVLKGYRSTFVMGEDGKPKRLNTSETSTQSYKIKYKYDSSGRLEEETVIYQIIGDKKERTTYKYKDGKLETSFFADNNSLRTKVVAVLDEKNNVVEEIYSISSTSAGTYSISSGSFETMPSAATSAQRNSVERGVIPGSGDTILSNRSSAVDPAGNSSEIASNRRLLDTRVSSSSSASKQNKEARYAYTYEFDSQGNWIKRIMSQQARKQDGKTVSIPISVTYRTITYY